MEDFFYNGQEHFGAIFEEVTPIVTPDLSQLMEIFAIASPVLSSIEENNNIKSIDEYKNLKVTKDTYFTARNFLIVSPFMLDDLNQAVLNHVRDSKGVLEVAIKVIGEFAKCIASLMGMN